MAQTKNWLLMFTVALALFMDVLDSNVINTSIPAMSRSLQVYPVDLKIALISYLLSIAIFIPTSGWVADKYGTKNIFIAAQALFVLSSFWCGFATSLPQLVMARFVQGVGGAFMLSLGRLIIARTFKRHELVEALNTIIIVVAIAVMIGPFIGGFITDHFSWPWIFWVNIPTGLLAMALSAYCIHDHTPRQSRPFDKIGFVLFCGSLALFTFALSSISESHTDLVTAFYMIVAAGFMFTTFILTARRKEHPIIKLSLFRIRSYRTAVFGNIFTRFGFGGMPFLLPLLQQIGLGFSAQLSGLVMVPMAFGIIFSKLTASRLLKRLGYKLFLQLNTLIVGLVICWFMFIHEGTAPMTIATMTFILGIFISSQFTAMNSLAYADIHENDLSASTTITSTVQILAQSIGVGISAILLRLFSAFAHTPLTPAVFHYTFLTMGILTMVSSIFFWQLQKGDGDQMLKKTHDNL